MKTVLLSIALVSTVLTGSGGDRERGLQLYQQGKFQAAQQAFVAALVDDPGSAELQWNLALAAWRAGDLATAEVAAEKYAAQADNAKVELHRGLLGAIRFGEAEAFEQQAQAALEAMAAAGPAGGAAGSDPAKPQPPADPLALLQQALGKAEQAKKHFVHGVRSSAPKEATKELVRNTERTLQKIKDLRKLIEELEKQQQEQEQQDGDKNPDDKKPEDGDEQKDDNESDKQEGDDSQGQKEKSDQQDKKEGEPKDQKSDESKPQNGEGEDPSEKPEPKPGEDPPDQPPEPQPGESNPGEGEPGEPKPDEPKPGEPNPDEPKPGEPNPGDPEPKPDQENGEESQQPAGADEPPEAPEPKPGEQRSDAPGEGARGLELSPEQAQRLLERMKKLDEKMKQARARRSSRRRAVERDW